jgi:hypothetical protein
VGSLGPDGRLKFLSALTLDLSVPEQSYIEDCPVCCRPMAVSYVSVDGELAKLSVESAD